MTLISDQRLAVSSERSLSLQLEAMKRQPVAAGVGSVKFVPVLMRETCGACGGQLYLHSEGVVCVCADCFKDYRYVNGEVQRS